MANENRTRPDKELHLPDSDVTFKMSYLMMNDILRYVGGPDEAVSAILTNQDTRDLIVRRLLTNNSKPIEKLEELIPIEDVEIDIFEVDEVLAWVMEHVTYFFMKTADKVMKAVGRYPEVAKQMTTSSDPSENGSTPSQTQTKSAGPTE